MFYKYASFIKVESYIFTKEVNNIISRYNCSKNHGIQSFGSDYDKVPAFWIDCLNLIESEINKAQKHKAEK